MSCVRLGFHAHVQSHNQGPEVTFRRLRGHLLHTVTFFVLIVSERLKYCLKKPFNPKQPTNQSQHREYFHEYSIYQIHTKYMKYRKHLGKDIGFPWPNSRLGQWGLEPHCILGTADERRSPSLSFRCLILP